MRSPRRSEKEQIATWTKRLEEARIEHAKFNQSSEPLHMIMSNQLEGEIKTLENVLDYLVRRRIIPL